MITTRDNPRLHHVSVDAMNTTFTFRLDCDDAEKAKDAASACINQLEEMEAELSRFRPDSDVSRINRLGEGESLYIAERVHRCLLKAAEAQAATAGLFDATLGSHTWEGRDASRPLGSGTNGQLEIAPDRPLVSCNDPGRQIDLGGIGKGFALDELARTLSSWQITSALLCAGASTMLAVGPGEWPVSLTGDQAAREIGLQGRALSASGTGLQGAHVVHPDAPDEEPSYTFRRIWVLAPDAALADAFSTACLLMIREELEAFAHARSDDVEVVAEHVENGSIHRISS